MKPFWIYNGYLISLYSIYGNKQSFVPILLLLLKKLNFVATILDFWWLSWIANGFLTLYSIHGNEQIDWTIRNMLKCAKNCQKWTDLPKICGSSQICRSVLLLNLPKTCSRKFPEGQVTICKMGKENFQIYSGTCITSPRITEHIG